MKVFVLALLFALPVMASNPQAISVSAAFMLSDKIQHDVSGILYLSKEKDDKVEYKGYLLVTAFGKNGGNQAQEVKYVVKTKDDGYSGIFHLRSGRTKYDMVFNPNTLLPASGQLINGSAKKYQRRRCGRAQHCYRNVENGPLDITISY